MACCNIVVYRAKSNYTFVITLSSDVRDLTSSHSDPKLRGFTALSFVGYDENRNDNAYTTIAKYRVLTGLGFGSYALWEVHMVCFTPLLHDIKVWYPELSLSILTGKSPEFRR